MTGSTIKSSAPSDSLEEGRAMAELGEAVLASKEYEATTSSSSLLGQSREQPANK